MRAKRDSVNRLVRCPFDQVDTAYRRGKRDGLRGKTLQDNPYPEGGRLQTSVCSGWVRGLLSANNKRGEG
jgi:hypothetical protein